MSVASTTGFKINNFLVIGVDDSNYEVASIKTIDSATVLKLKGTGLKNAYAAGTAVKHRGISEVDLLEVKLEANGLNGGVVKLKVASGNEFWDKEWKQTKSNGGVQIVGNERFVNFTVDADNWTRTVWMEILQPSVLQGIKLELSNPNAATNKVSATGVWANLGRFRNGQQPHTTTSLNIMQPVSAGATEIRVPLGQSQVYFVGQQIFIRDNQGADDLRTITALTPGSSPTALDIIEVDAGVSRNFGNFQQGGEVFYLADATRLSCNADGQDIRDIFIAAGGKLGVTQVWPFAAMDARCSLLCNQLNC